MGMPVDGAYDQATFRARTSVTDPASADAAFDAGDAAAGANWTQTVDQLIRVRGNIDRLQQRQNDLKKRLSY